MAATFNARKTIAMDGKPLDRNGAPQYDIFRNDVFFATISRGHNNEWCFKDACDERRGYQVRATLTRRLGRDKAFADMLPIIREIYA